MGYQRLDPSSNHDYFIIRPEKIRWFNILSLFLLRRKLTSYGFVETDSSEDGLRADILTPLVFLIQKFLTTIAKPLKYFGLVLEFVLNLVALNGGIFGLIYRIITVSLVIPKRDAANFRSMLALIDDRVKLAESSTTVLTQFYPYAESLADISNINVLDLTLFASKIAYENEAYVTNVVNNVWKMRFVGFYNFWNKFLNESATQAFVFCNKASDADLIVVAFRGTEPFNAQDWSTDVDLSWIFANKLGNLHLGFLKALGLQDEKSFILGFPKNLPSSVEKPVAYYALRDKLRALLKENSNAKVAITGHSLGGALACIFPALLSYHNEADIVGAIHGVYTYGQPRVGDAIFGAYVENIVRKTYYRMVFRYDAVPRVPFDFPPVALFKHCGKCVYYLGWHKAKFVDDVPNPNYFDPLFSVSMYANAWGDLFKGIFAAWTEGKEYKEGLVSIGFRGLGLVIPGIASHGLRDYVNGGRLAQLVPKSMV
ncbi:hypothetical protein HPP92_004335 [Vanilla planifolia]|uniref:Fungal lipase-type domain-containing protein n=1 Tax=Vanilla planifolia TaxID=51239 RepID=A0A835VGB8_VANPL|nr:hypothetical protein HPP92_004335 [Vanilla planifolia]